ncbi:hypothetical protein OH77DRAFT_948713 [Trametes cingulata]|nr:hypothetical protein OH77DRAFT_948713 [Trametes cingulata]
MRLKSATYWLCVRRRCQTLIYKRAAYFVYILIILCCCAPVVARMEALDMMWWLVHRRSPSSSKRCVTLYMTHGCLQFDGTCGPTFDGGFSTVGVAQLACTARH